MAQSVGDALLGITVDKSQVGRAIVDAIGAQEGTIANEGKKLSKSLTGGLSEGLTSFQKFGAGVAAVGAIVAGVSLKMALDFESSLTSIKALTGSSSEDIALYRKSILSLSGDVAQSPKKLAEALYFVSSAGFAGKEAIDVLTVSAQAAAAGLTDTKVVADAVTSAMNAYGHANLTAKQATDILTQTVTDGKAEFGDIAGAIGQVVGVASAAGVSFAELGAAMAGLTGVGISADEAATTIKSTLIALEAPSEKVKDMLGQLGISADDLRKSVRDKGLVATIQDLSNRLGGQIGPLLELIPNHRTLALVLGATGAQAQQYNDILGRVNNASAGAGATARAFAERQKDVKFQIDQTIASAEAIAVSFGEKLIPIVRTSIEVFRSVVGFLDQNKVAAYALAVIIGGPLVGAMVAWTVAETRIIVGKLIAFWSSLADVAVGLVGKLLGLNTALSAIGTTEETVAATTGATTGVMVSGFGLVGAAIALVTFTMAQGEDGAKKLRTALASVADDEILQRFRDLDKLSNQGLGFKAIAQVLTGQTHSGLTDEFKKLADQSPATAQRVVDAMKRSGQSTDEYQKILDKVVKGHQQAGKDAEKTAEITKQASGSEKAVISDLTQAQQKHQDAIDGVVTSLKAVGPIAGNAADALIQGTKLSDDDLKNLAKSIDKVRDAYKGLPGDSAQALSLLAVQGKLTGDQLAAVADQAKQLRDGMASSFSSATSIVQAFGSETKVTFDQINKFFKDQVKAAQDWSVNLKALVAAGVDQGLIAELAQAGPKAAPLVAGLLDDVKRGNLGIINQSQTDLRDILTQTQGTILGYETPFFIAGQTDGQGLTSGLGQGVAGAGSAMQAALATAIAASNLYNYLQAAGIDAGQAFAGGFAGALERGTVTAFQSIGGGVQSLKSVIAAHNAAGSVVQHPLLSWLAEDGPEVVIPLNDPRRAAQLVSESGLDDLLSGRSGGATGATGGSTPTGSGDVYHFNFPNYLGSREELTRQLSQAMRSRQMGRAGS